MRYLSVCSGIEAATVAWHDLGWKPLAFSEIEAFPRAVLKHHYPDVPLHGDFTTLKHEPWVVDADILVGGTPCQAFSVAGLRGSLSDERGNLSLEFIRLANAIDDFRRDAGREPAYILWENVPGVLSVSDNAFGAFLAGLVGHDTAIDPPRGRGWTNAGVVHGPKRVAAWRVLDAQHFGVAQRRRRVFVLAVGHPGAWRCADALLPIIHSLSGHPAPRREAGQAVANCLTDRADRGGTNSEGQRLVSTIDASFGRLQGCSGQDANHGHSHLVAFGGNRTSGPIDVAPALNACGTASGRQDFETEAFVTHSLTARMYSKSSPDPGAGRGGPVVPVAFHHNAQADQLPTAGRDTSIRDALTCSQGAAVAFAQNQRDELRTMDVAGALASQPGMKQQTFVAVAGHAPAIAVQGDTPMLETPWDAQEKRIHDVRRGVAPTLSSRSNGGGTVDGWFATHTSAVRRLTPVECERLQGFPDNYTNIPWRGKPTSPDGPRYKALGNSMAVPCMAWIGRRIAAVEALASIKEAAE